MSSRGMSSRRETRRGRGEEWEWEFEFHWRPLETVGWSKGESDK